MSFSPTSLPLVNGVAIHWQSALYGLAGRIRYPHAAVNVKSMRRSLNLYYHGLGGAIEQRLGAEEAQPQDARQISAHGGMDLQAWTEKGKLHLPRRINRYSNPELNRELFYWLAAYLALDEPIDHHDALPLGVQHLLQGIATSNRVLATYPALSGRFQRLCRHELSLRESSVRGVNSRLSPAHLLESSFRFALGSETPPNDEFLVDAMAAANAGESIVPPKHWQSRKVPFLPVPLWAYRRRNLPHFRLKWFKRSVRQSQTGDERSIKNPHFDSEYVPTSSAGRSAKGDFVYPEWDFLASTYKRNWCRVTEQNPKKSVKIGLDPSFEDLVRRVRNRYGNLHLEPHWNRNLEHGRDLDIDAFVTALGDSRGCGHAPSNFYRQQVRKSRDLSVLILMDASRSTEAWVNEARVINVAKQSIAVLAQVLAGTCESFAIFSFSSDSRLRVRFDVIKEFDESYDQNSQFRLLSVRPMNYTRMGAAIRHAGAKILKCRSSRKLLLVLSDGRPHDPTDRYEGRYALEDTRKALNELRNLNVQCFGLTIDRKGQQYLPYLYGPGHYAVYAYLHSLPQALLNLYAELTGLTNRE